METVTTKHYIKTKETLKYDYIEGVIFILYFCYDVYNFFSKRIIGAFTSSMLFYFLYFGCIIYYALTRGAKKYITPLICYIIVFFLFAWAYLKNPELAPWIYSNTFSVYRIMLQVNGGIWAFFILSLVTDREALLLYLRISAFVLFAFLCIRFIRAQIMGYWITIDSNNNYIKSSYEISFGYEMLFVVLFFLAEAFLNEKKYYYIPLTIGIIEILLAGSRGPFLCLLCSLVPIVIFRWKKLDKENKKLLALIMIILCPVIIYTAFNYEKILLAFCSWLGKMGINSRTINAFVQGEITNLSGRDKITEITLETIKEGGLFGNGVFGERVAVGQRVVWGYAHNFFLEIYAAFGYIGGTLVIAGLLYLIIYTAIKCKNPGDQIIFVAFFGSCIKLVMSDSFWFNRSFWALLAIMIMWRKQDKEKIRCSISGQGSQLFRYVKC